MPADVVLRGGRVIDPAAGVDGLVDVAIAGDQVVAVGRELGGARQLLDVTGLLVVPGLVDLHVHLDSGNDGEAGHAMLARSGVTTALDMAGPAADVLAIGARYGAGLSIACVESLQIGRHVPERATDGDVRIAFEQMLTDGAIGVKLHYDSGLDPDLTALAIEEGTAEGLWVASHCGTTATGSDLDGMRETLELAGGRPLHVAHVNSYCRGQVGDPVVEARHAIKLLREADRVFSESYLAAINGTWAGFSNGRPEVARVAGWLEAAGHPPTRAGMAAAIRAGMVRIPHREGDEVVLHDGDAGVAVWEAAGTRTGACFAINPAASRILLAGSRDAGGSFDVDALATDGGGIPRNDTVALGLALVDLGVLSYADLVTKACLTPARALGLSAKGTLAAGADADVAVIDPAARRVRTTIAGGRVVMHDGAVLGRGTRALVTELGRRAAADAGCEPTVLDLGRSPVCTGAWT